MITLNEVTYRVKQKEIIHSTSVDFHMNQHTIILGPNGAGKSTLLRIAAGGILPTSGNINRLGIKNPYNANELARQRAFLGQNVGVSVEFTVRDLIMMGRYPHFHRIPSVEDLLIIERVIEKFNLQQFESRKLTQLSGGELQRAHVARVYAQLFTNQDEKSLAGKFIFMDEPVNNLDIKHQQQLMELSQELVQKGVGVVAVLHDINMALTYADRILFVKNGQIVADFPDTSRISTEVLEEVYEISFQQLGEYHFFPKSAMETTLYQVI